MNITCDRINNMDKESFPIVEAVRERDIDLLMLEELFSATSFEKLFLEIIQKSEYSFSKAYRSITEAGLGETDILIECTNGEKKLYVLVENKIDALFQDAQYERYIKRSESLAKQVNTEAYVVLVAPEHYIQNKSEFEYNISYESIRDWYITNVSERRSWYKQQLLTLAIDQERRGYQVVKDEAVTKLWQEYYLFVTDKVPGINMGDPKSKPANSSFVYFKPSIIPLNTRLIHKMEKGYIDFELSGQAEKYTDIVAKYTDVISDDMEIVVTGKSLAIRIEVPTLSFEKTFDEQLPAMGEVVSGLRLMLEWIRSNAR